MKFEDFKLPYGYPIQLQAGTGNESVKINSRLIGCIPGKFILISLPKSGARLRTGQKAVVRIMASNGICLFSTNLESTLNLPIPMMCLAYPNSVNFKEIRGATRVDVSLSIDVSNISSLEEQVTKGKLTDISLSGAKIELEEPIGDVGEELSIKMSVAIADMTKELSIKSLVRSRIERSTKEYDEGLPAVYGIEFIESEESQKMGLYAYVYSSMAVS
jgi:c-di-GMP-binding flagellar brake protein YcgR